MSKTTFHIISHTHWDREWYFPYEVFRIELVELVDNLLNILKQNKDFIFHLDGQSIILQDYLEIKPEKEEEIKKYIKSGNIQAGPWYILSDQFLSSGEATIRNLLYGIRLARSFGNVMLVGYLPDQFGQIAQLPQILKGFNISSAILGRGIQDGFSEHNWYGLNGDCITAVALTHWYNNAQRLPKENLEKYLENIYNTQHKTSKSEHVLLMNGCDHIFPQENLNEIVKTSNGNQRWELKQNTLTRALNNIIENNNSKDYPIYYGELRADNNRHILAGTLSSRIYLKLSNYECQTKLEKVLEPLSTLFSINKIRSYPYNQMKQAWKLLIQNQAHDSICGCSTDSVHKEMEIRFLKVNQILDKLKENLLSPLPFAKSNTQEKHYLQLINLTNFHRNELIEAELEFLLGNPALHPGSVPIVDKEEIKNFTLKHKDKNIDFIVLESYKTTNLARSKDEVPLPQAVQKVKILFEANVEPFSVCTYEIEKQENEEVRKQGKESLTRFEFENSNYKLNINKNGTLSIQLRDSNYKFENIHFLTIEDDLGDEYHFMPNKEGKTANSKDWKWEIKIIEDNDYRRKFLLINKEIIQIKVKITCHKSSNRIDFKTKINNDLRNKRVRLHIPTNLATNCLSADTPFGVLLRARPSVDWSDYAVTQPLHNWIDHSNDEAGLAFFGGGLSEYELYKDGNGFVITLIRAIGKLSAVQSLSFIETPEAQCNRELEFNYAMYPHKGNWKDVKAQDINQGYQIPIITNQSTQKTELPSMFTISSELVVSSLKRSEDREGIYVLRLYNPTNKILSNCKLKLNFPFSNLYKFNLNEEINNSLGSTGEISFTVNPYEIVTFGIEAQKDQ